jgi:uncharacterized repeat protein (TIGR02543 family)
MAQDDFIAQNDKISGVTLVNGEALKTVYVYDGTSVRKQYNLYFSIAEPDASGDPDWRNVASIAIGGDPKKTYSEGQTFDRLGMTVTATLNGDGGDKPVQGYKVMPQHVYEEYENGSLGEYYKAFFDENDLSGPDDDNFYLHQEEFNEYMEGFEKFFEESFEEYWLEYWEEYGLGGLDNDDGKDYRLTIGDTYVLVFFGTHRAKLEEITVNPTASIADVCITNGQMYDDYTFDIPPHILLKKTVTFDAVVWHEEQYGRFTFRVSTGAEVRVEGNPEALAKGDDGLYLVELPTTEAGTSTDVTVKAKVFNGESYEDYEKVYTFTCYSQAYDDMPAEVVDYLPIAGQFINGVQDRGWYGLNPTKTLHGRGLADDQGEALSLGGFGGYIIYRYPENKPIIDDPRNPFGVDFIVYPNAYGPNSGFAEPGNVLVSENGIDWYTLAGSIHYEDSTDWNYSRTYTNKGGIAEPTEHPYPIRELYPLFGWNSGLEKSMTLTGVLLVGPDDRTPPFPDFGYADTGVRTTKNTAGNPYIGLNSNNERTTTDGFDLKWAVDKNGEPVDLSNVAIYYVKIQTGNKADYGRSGLGEKSTEINGVRIAAKSSDKVGKTPLPSQILVAGREIDLNGGTGAYSSLYEAQVNANGFSVVVVPVSSESNVYINGERGAARAFGAMPEHKMLRVIVQEGEKEPAIVYVDLEANSSVQETPVVTVTFNAAGGTGSPTARAFTSDMPEESLIFPTPVRATETTSGVGHHPFLGWFDKDNNEYKAYDPDKIKEDITLTAKWGDPVLDAVTTTITFDANGGTFPSGKGTAEQTYELGMMFPTLTRAGYTFDGWYYEGKKQTVYSEDLDVKEGLTFTAQWTLKTTTVTFDAKGGLFTSTGKETISRAYSVESTDKNFPTPVREGYKFIGWFDSKGTEYKAYSAALEDVAELALTAKWEADKTAISKDETPAQGGGEAAPTTIKAEHAVTLVVNPEPKTVNGETVQSVTITDKMLTEAIEKAVAAAAKATPAAGGVAPKPQILLPPSVERGTVTLEAVKFLADSSTPDVEILIPFPGGVEVLDKALSKALNAALENADLTAETNPEIEREIAQVTPDDTPLKEDARSADIVAVYDVVYKAGNTELKLDAPEGEPFTITLPYKLNTDRDGNPEDARGIKVVHIPTDGKTEATDDSGYYEDIEQAWFKTTHLSLYAVTYDPTRVPAKQDPEEDPADSPGGGCGTGAIGFAALTALATGAALRRKPREDGR